MALWIASVVPTTDGGLSIALGSPSDAPNSNHFTVSTDVANLGGAPSRSTTNQTARWAGRAHVGDTFTVYIYADAEPVLHWGVSTEVIWGEWQDSTQIPVLITEGPFAGETSIEPRGWWNIWAPGTTVRSKTFHAVIDEIEHHFAPQDPLIPWGEDIPPAKALVDGLPNLTTQDVVLGYHCYIATGPRPILGHNVAVTDMTGQWRLREETYGALDESSDFVKYQPVLGQWATNGLGTYDPHTLDPWGSLLAILKTKEIQWSDDNAGAHHVNVYVRPSVTWERSRGIQNPTVGSYAVVFPQPDLTLVVSQETNFDSAEPLFGGAPLYSFFTPNDQMLGSHQEDDAEILWEDVTPDTVVVYGFQATVGGLVGDDVTAASVEFMLNYLGGFNLQGAIEYGTQVGVVYPNYRLGEFSEDLSQTATGGEGNWPVSEAGYIPPLRQRARNDGLTTDTRQEKRQHAASPMLVPTQWWVGQPGSGGSTT